MNAERRRDVAPTLAERRPGQMVAVQARPGEHLLAHMLRAASVNQALLFADPYLTCDQCNAWVTGWHDPDQCGPGCDQPAVHLPCEHKAGLVSTCPSWGPVEGCQCQEHLGHVPHSEPA